MKKRFNITGICFPDSHYMVDTSSKLRQTLEMVEVGEYFVINRPRQYGKTTMLANIQNHLDHSEEYFPIALNFQGIDRKWHESDEAFALMFVQELIRALKFTQQELTELLQKNLPEVKDMSSLSDVITEMAHAANKKMVLLIDEVDASSNYTPFLSFLAMLRTKYLSRSQPQHATFHSIVLAGVHDIKSLKYKLRNPEDAQYNSPWNIATDFEVRMSFDPAEITTMLKQYQEAEGVEMDQMEIANQLYYHTSGYPFLVSKLCKTIAEKLLPKKAEKRWEKADVEEAVQMTVRENNTNFDSLIKNLENHQKLYNLVYRVLIDSEQIPANPHEPTISLGRMYGVFKSNGRLSIHNRIYEQIIYDYLIAKTLVQFSKGQNLAGHFLLEKNELDMQGVLLRFQQFMKENFSDKQDSFLETHGRLVFLSFLTPILNGVGHAFKEVQVSQEKRLDIVVTYFEHRYIIELKRWYGPEYHERGLAQLADYLEAHSLDTGFLLIFDDRKKKDWKQQWIDFQGKRIFAVWV